MKRRKVLVSCVGAARSALEVINRMQLRTTSMRTGSGMIG